MPSHSKNKKVQAPGGSSSQQDHKQSYMLREFLRADPTEPERLYGMTESKKGGKNNQGHDDKAKEAVKKFEDAWRNATR
ncbi:hypothetical protein F4818DRAFT_453176 [Hypoxylon cercidicola]|nr:hypothetical protein F4818DRAFT_453176 [Hypoxylon cercidicola]